MKKIFLLSFSLIVLSLTQVQAQQGEGSIMVSGAGDIIRTDLPGVIQRYQLGLETHYFVRYFLSLSGGYEFNHNNFNQATLGTRLYFADPVFVRFRGLIGRESDVALGLGYSHNLSYRFRLEGMVDYYAVTGAVGLRGGISVVIN